MATVAEDLARVYREEFGQVVATLTAAFGDIEVAEEAVQEAFTIAAERWPAAGTPPNPGGWITTTARRRAIDRLRREASRNDRQAMAAMLDGPPGRPPGVGVVQDDRLKLIFTCCHPALAVETQVALALRMLGGLRTGEVARALLVSERAMEQRLVRAKRKIRATNLPFRVPAEPELSERLQGVLAVVYLIFNEGYLATTGDGLGRVELSEEGLRLARLLTTLMPDEPEVQGLLALLLLTHARRDARTDAAGDLVVLAEQDRSRWDPAAIAEGQALVRGCLRRNRPGPYQFQAAIAAVHAAEDTDWQQVLTLYDQWMAVAPTPVVELNRAIALAEIRGPAAALDALDSLDGLDGYHHYHATRAAVLRRLGRQRDALDGYRRARELTDNQVEQRHLDRQLAAILDEDGVDDTTGWESG
jgi:RNA polymerase sigma-70 factor, ECF subfamily